MMRRNYRPSRRHRKNSAFKNIASTASFVVIGAAAFYVGLSWFRAHNTVSENVLARTELYADALQPADVSAAEVLPSHANLLSAFDGQVTGTVNRSTGEKKADYHALVYLPGIDRNQETYGVWLLKDGLADVKRMGDLSPRSDGSWALDFTAGPVSGISSPEAYRTVVIMKEPKGSSGTPEGTKMAEAVF
jgi:hypothetical protein